MNRGESFSKTVRPNTNLFYQIKARKELDILKNPLKTCLSLKTQ
jgi:hypothetical protein